MFQSDRQGGPGIFWQPADGSADAERLTTAAAGEEHIPESWHPREDVLLFSVVKGGEYTLQVYSVRDRKDTPFGDVRSTIPTDAVFSPDGKWVAYTGGGSINGTIYVKPYPLTTATYELPRTVAGAPHHPLWLPGMAALVFDQKPGFIHQIGITMSPVFAFGDAVSRPRKFQTGPPNVRRAIRRPARRTPRRPRRTWQSREHGELSAVQRGPQLVRRAEGAGTRAMTATVPFFPSSDRSIHGEQTVRSRARGPARHSAPARRLDRAIAPLQDAAVTTVQDDGPQPSRWSCARTSDDARLRGVGTLTTSGRIADQPANSRHGPRRRRAPGELVPTISGTMIKRTFCASTKARHRALDDSFPSRPRRDCSQRSESRRRVSVVRNAWPDRRRSSRGDGSKKPHSGAYLLPRAELEDCGG